MTCILNTPPFFTRKYSHVKRGRASSARVQFRAAGGDSSGEDTERLLNTCRSTFSDVHCDHY